MHDRPPQRAAETICEFAHKEVLRARPTSQAAAEDFLLAARVRVALIDAGHDVAVSCAAGRVDLVIDRFVVRLERLEAELKRIAGALPGVGGVQTLIGPHFRVGTASAFIAPQLDLPSRVLLVDDERDFVEALSERLSTRNIGSAVVYDGEQALSLLNTDEPEVMVLDLRMPGVDGIEVLQRVKRDYPNVEVIILTGHGSQGERDLALQLGAFAYLEKPIDIDQLTRTMKEAYLHSKSLRSR